MPIGKDRNFSVNSHNQHVKLQRKNYSKITIAIKTYFAIEKDIFFNKIMHNFVVGNQSYPIDINDNEHGNIQRCVEELPVPNQVANH